jgi:drug/metabolite transporter (DMT)-like permease
VLWSVFAVLAVGCVAYGLSIFFYVYAQRHLGAARTSAYYAIAPFIGTFLSLIIFKDIPPYTYFIALVLMAIGAWLCASDETILHKKQAKKKARQENKRLPSEEICDNLDKEIENNS